MLYEIYKRFLKPICYNVVDDCDMTDTLRRKYNGKK